MPQTRYLYAKAKLELLQILQAASDDSEKGKGWGGKDPDWVNRDKGRFTKSNTGSDNAEKADKSTETEGIIKQVKLIEDSVSKEFEDVFDKIGGKTKELDTAIKKLTETERENLYKTLISPESIKAQKSISEKLLKSVSPEAREAYDKTINGIREAAVARKRHDTIDITGITNKVVDEMPVVVGKSLLSTAAVLGTIVALGATLGTTGYMLAGAGLLATKNWSIPNMQGRGGEQATEKFLGDEKNRENTLGIVGTYLRGSISNALYTTGVHTAMLISGIMLYQSFISKEGRKELGKSLDDFTNDIHKQE